MSQNPPFSIAGAAAWRLYEYEVAGSTNDIARHLPPWNAVRADAQTGGRGRYGRAFVSDPGGLWISAVVPSEGATSRWLGFSLVVGWHVREVLRELDIPPARVRWPNDLLIGKRKLAGILIEQSSAQTFIVGLGMNVTNTPWQHDPALENNTTRLADFLSEPPSVHEMAVKVLDAIAEAHGEMAGHGLSRAAERLNAHWADAQAVEVHLAGGEILSGSFLGIDEAGNLRVKCADQVRTVEYQRVERMAEVT
jgi:BirA family biotin operon repressor/biotin-[acetyl-CoA-carboxylase] ligase